MHARCKIAHDVRERGPVGVCGGGDEYLAGQPGAGVRGEQAGGQEQGGVAARAGEHRDDPQPAGRVVAEPQGDGVAEAAAWLPVGGGDGDGVAGQVRQAARRDRVVGDPPGAGAVQALEGDRVHGAGVGAGRHVEEAGAGHEGGRGGDAGEAAGPRGGAERYATGRGGDNEVGAQVPRVRVLGRCLLGGLHVQQGGGQAGGEHDRCDQGGGAGAAAPDGEHRQVPGAGGKNGGEPAEQPENRPGGRGGEERGAGGSPHGRGGGGDGGG